MNRLRAFAAAIVLLYAVPALADPSAEEVMSMLRVIDDRQANNGDVAAKVLMERKETGKSDLVLQAMVYRRDSTEKLAILFVRPEAEAGRGYLRIDRNLFFYDPAVGNWERHTERDRIGGTDSRRQDFDRSRLVEEYEPTWLGEAALGQLTAHHIELEAKPGVDVAYPRAEIWVDKASGNLLKRQDYALSGRLLRTTYYPRWQRVYSESKGDHVYLPKEIRIFDEVQDGNQTTILVQEVDLTPIEDSVFTKAWLESKSR